MTTYVAFLRGINVGGYNRMTMDDLRALVESLGYEDVRTYIQSGNVVFESSAADDRALAEDLAAAVDDAFGYDVTVMVRSRDDLETIVVAQPFDASDDDAIRRYVTFLQAEPTDDGVDALLAAADEAERFAVVGRDVYSEIDTDALGDRARTDAGAKLGTPATRRYWNVVTSVLELASS